MKTLLIAIAVLFSACCGSAQICTPVTVNTGPDPTDTNRGPNDQFFYYGPDQVVHGIAFSPSKTYASLTIAAEVLGLNSDISGSVNVREGFNGCEHSTWNQEVYHQFSLTDTGTSQHWDYPQQGTEYNCGKTGGPYLSYCLFAQSDPAPNHWSYADFRNSAGHHFRLDLKTYAVIFGPDFGSSVPITYSLYITVE